MNNRYVQIMMKLIRSEITKTPLELSEELTDDDLKAVFAISKRHDLAHLTGYALEKNGFLKDDEIGKRFKKEKNLAIYRYFNLDSALKEICDAFEESEIPFIPLKGSVIRDLYPEPWMRTSCDVDILVKEEDLDRASKVLTDKFGYEQAKKGFHDISFYKNDQNLHIELHYSLIGNRPNMDAVLQYVWDKIFPIDSRIYHMQMSNEMFYFYHIAHMAKHFDIGGCGVRPFIDMWILNHNMSFDNNEKNSLLKQASLSKFEKQCERLSDIWFGDEKHSDLTKQIEEYILTSGTYGNEKNRINILNAKESGKIKQLLHRLWMPYDTIKNRYLILKKYPFLLPFCEILRLIELFFNGRLKNVREETKTIANISMDSKQSTLTMLEQLGLK